MVVHAAFGGSTNMILHIPAIAHAAGLNRPTIDDWTQINRAVPRLVDVLPNGPVNHPTLRAYLAGGVPEVMLHLRAMGLLRLDAAPGLRPRALGDVLRWWEGSERRRAARGRLRRADGVEPDDVILSPDRRKAIGRDEHDLFPPRQPRPGGLRDQEHRHRPACVIDADGVFRKTGRARVFVRETDAVAAVKGTTDWPIEPGDVIVLICRGPLGAGMEETYQLTSALKHLSFGHEVALVTDARSPA